MTKDIVYRITSLIPRGKITTYQELAILSGYKNPRVIGNILHANPYEGVIPCHRVVNSQGSLAPAFAFGGPDKQAQKLQREGLEVVNGKVNLEQYLWEPNKVLCLFFELLREYGEPGPWPWFGTGPDSTPEEIAIGSILTQNTSWRNVVKAMNGFKQPVTISGIYELGNRDYARLVELLRPTRYFNQKAKRLLFFCNYIIENYESFEDFLQTPLGEAREALLSLWGLGKETVDTILLYCGNKRVFVIDEYTKRFARYHNLTDRLDYDSLQEYFQTYLPKDVFLYQSYHALIVWWGQRRKI